MVKGPIDTAQRPTARERETALGKAFLRRNEFLDQRGLSREPRKLALGPAARTAAPASPYLRAVREKTALRDESPPDPGIVWRSLGPAGIPNGQTYGDGTTTVSGRVSAIAVDPNDSGHLLVAAAAGGVWQTRDGGASWTPQTDEMPTLSIGALAFDPSDPTKVYAGTGEGNSEYAPLGHGILVSNDGGSTWTVIAAELFAGVGFYRLVVDPRDGKRLIVATTGAAALTTDAGSSWSLLHPGTTWDVSLAYRGDEPEILLATPDGLFATRGGGITGQDGGLHPAPAQVAVPDLPPLDPRYERMAVAHVPSDPGQAFVFAASRGHAHLWRRPAADQPFVPVALPSFGVPALPPSDVPPTLEDVLDVGQAEYDWYVSVPPARDDVVYLGAKELVKGERVGGGWNWSDISSRQGRGDSIHPDQHAIAFDPHHPDVIYAGNDGGVFRSPDAGGSWQSLNAGLAISEVEYLTQRPDEPTWILAGLQDNGTIRREGTNRWALVALGDGGDCGTNMADPDVCFHSREWMATERSSKRGDPDAWKDVSPPGPRDPTYQLFYPPLEVNGNVVAKAGQIVYVSKNRADSWVGWCLPQPERDDGNPCRASALAIPTQDQVLVGTTRGDVFRIDLAGDASSALTALTKPPTKPLEDGSSPQVSDLFVSPRPERYWVTFSRPGSVFRSDDRGTTWIDVTANLPPISVNAVVTDPVNSDRVWVACDVGVFESRDAGGSWAVFGTGLPNALAEDLVFYEPDRLLRVGTRSRGVWEAAVG